MNIKTIAIIVLFLSNCVVEAAGLHYMAKGTLVGTMIDAKVQYNASKSKYNIRIDMRAAGIIKKISGGQIESHTSYGSVRDGEYFAKEYKIEKRFRDIHYIRRYLFDYKKQKITKISIKWKNGKKLYKNTEVLKYFAHNDILTLYHNILRYKKSHPSGYFAIALAGAEKEGGKLKFLFPSGSKLQDERQSMGEKNANIIKIYMKRKFLSGGKGDLTFAIDKDGIASKVLLNSVKMLGKVILKRIK